MPDGRCARAGRSPGTASGPLTELRTMVPSASASVVAPVVEFVVAPAVEPAVALAVALAVDGLDRPAVRRCACGASTVCTGVVLVPTVLRVGTVGSGSDLNASPVTTDCIDSQPVMETTRIVPASANAPAAPVPNRVGRCSCGRRLLPLWVLPAMFWTPAGFPASSPIGRSECAVERGCAVYAKPAGRRRKLRLLRLHCFPSRLRSSVGRAAAF